MVDEEVENILSQIRERVRAQPLPSASAVSRQENGAGDSPVTAREPRAALSPEARDRIESYLTTTARSWNRLPPLMSNRSGSTARFELWVKSLIKRATHWFTWEQVNFNAAAHHAIRDTLETLAAVEQELGRLRAETNSQRTMLQQSQAETETLRADLQAQRAAIEMQRVEVEKYRRAREAERPLEAEAYRKEFHARLSELSQELQERLAQLTDEQRVCFKQLSLEATEAAVLEDRARRKTEALLEELRGRIDELKNSKT